MTQSGHSDDGNASIGNRQLVSAANCLGVGEGMPHDVNRLAPMSIREPVNGGSSAADNRDRGANAGLRHMSFGGGCPGAASYEFDGGTGAYRPFGVLLGAGT